MNDGFKSVLVSVKQQWLVLKKAKSSWLLNRLAQIFTEKRMDRKDRMQ